VPPRIAADSNAGCICDAEAAQNICRNLLDFFDIKPSIEKAESRSATVNGAPEVIVRRHLDGLPAMPTPPRQRSRGNRGGRRLVAAFDPAERFERHVTTGMPSLRRAESATRFILAV